jgi:hypothetical protein
MVQRTILENTTDGELELLFGHKAKYTAPVSGFTDLVPAAASVINYQRGGASARQYPGDSTPISRGGATVEVLKPIPSYRSTLPGRPFWLETSTGSGSSKVTTVRQFTFTGTFRTLRAAVAAGALGDLVLRSPGGKAWPIVDATP